MLRVSVSGELGQSPRVSLVGLTGGMPSQTQDHLGTLIDQAGFQPTHRHLEQVRQGSGLKRAIAAIDFVVAGTGGLPTARSPVMGTTLLGAASIATDRVGSTPTFLILICQIGGSRTSAPTTSAFGKSNQSTIPGSLLRGPQYL